MRQIDYYNRIVPLKTSKRTTEEIIQSLEDKLSVHIIGRTTHDSVCRCERCIQIYLDKMLANSNALMIRFDDEMQVPIEIERWEN